MWSCLILRCFGSTLDPRDEQRHARGSRELCRFQRPGLAWPAAELAIGSGGGGLCDSRRPAPHRANLRHPLLGSQDAFDQGGDVQVRIQLGPVQAETCGRNFDGPKLSCFGARQALRMCYRKFKGAVRVE